MTCLRLYRAAVAALLGTGFAGGVSRAQDARQLEQQRRLASPLYQQASAAGGQMKATNIVAPGDQYADLPSLMRASDEVLLVNVASGFGELSPSGNSVFTLYTLQVMQAWKGPASKTVYLSVPDGWLAFDANTRAHASWRNFRPLQKGARYVVFLRYARGAEKQETPGRRLTGGGIQGAFELTDQDQVEPMFREDGVWRPLWHLPATAFMKQLDALAASQNKP
jgi:hypothetical protein